MAAVFLSQLRKRVTRAALWPALVSTAAAAVLALSVYHHALNLWGLGWQQAFLLLAGTIVPLAAAIDLLLGRMRPGLRRIPRLRWALFAGSALVFGGILAYFVYTLPVSWHRLEIAPTPGAQIVELKNSSGTIVPFEQLDLPAGWRVKDGALTPGKQAVEPLVYSFLGPAGRPVRLLFNTAQQGGQVNVRLDGQTAALDLQGDDLGQRELALDSRYRNLPNAAALGLIGLIDGLAFALALVFVWTAQEIGQEGAARQTAGRSLRNPAARDLFILLGIAVTVHALNALAAPLWLDVDSPSYLRGAVHWLQYHNLGGVSVQRGVGSTILFTPILAVFGRSPWGMKLLLHLFGIGCVPLMYALGWQLGGRRWFAFAAGLLAIFTPDVMFYANYVMSDLPNIFFTLLFVWALLKALQTRRPAWQIAALLTGSFAVLFRTENTTLMAAGAGFMGLQIVLDWLQRRTSLRAALKPAAALALACALAAVPLLWWSGYNARNNGFFGLSNYTGAVLYDGWIFFGESSNLPITDYNSPAVQAILTAHKSSGTPFRGDTWDDFAALTHTGSTPNQAYAILQQAALELAAQESGGGRASDGAQGGESPGAGHDRDEVDGLAGRNGRPGGGQASVLRPGDAADPGPDPRPALGLRLLERLLQDDLPDLGMGVRGGDAGEPVSQTVLRVGPGAGGGVLEGVLPDDRVVRDVALHGLGHPAAGAVCIRGGADGGGIHPEDFRF